jgi:Uma2 family endonuclease
MSRRASSPAIAAPIAEKADRNDGPARACYPAAVSTPAKMPRATPTPGEAVPPEKIWTPQEYLNWERQSPEKHEFIQGKVFAMAGASREHNLLVGNIVRLLGNALANRPCEAYPSDMKVRIPATGDYVYPDASALCGRPEFADQEDDILTNPQVIFEVLSDSTENFDSGEKFEGYKSIDSFKEYVLVSQEEVLIEHFVRGPDGSWMPTIHRAGDEFELSSLRCKLAVNDLYLKVFGAPGAVVP